MFGQVKKGDHYFLSSNQHIRNERVFFACHTTSIVQQLIQGQLVEKKKKLVQFQMLFWLLPEGRPMTQYAAFKELLTQLSLPNFPHKHWSSDSGWEVAEALAHVVSKTTKSILK
jgi:hypothetical protein